MSQAFTIAMGNVRQANRIGAFHLLTASVAIQGFAYISQGIIAAIVGPADFGLIRPVEAALSLLVMVGAFGFPSLAIRDIASLGSASARGVLLGRLLGVGFIVAFLTAVIATGISPFLVPGGSASYLRILAATIPLAVCSRIGLNYFQGIQQVRGVSIVAIIAAGLAAAMVTALTLHLRLEGWLAGRLVGEALFAGALLTYLRGQVAFSGQLPEVFKPSRLLRRGGTISGSRLLRAAQDSLFVLALTWFGATRAEVGYFGMASLLTLPLLMIPGVIANLALPRMVARLEDPVRLRAFSFRVGSWILALGAVGTVLTMGIGASIVTIALRAYLPAISVLGIVLLSVPFRTLASVPGAMLLAANQNHKTLVINAMTLLIAFGACAALIPPYGAKGAAGAVVVGEVVTLAVYIGSVKSLVRRPVT